MSNLELSVPYEDQVLNINGNPITLEDILEDTSLYINSSLFPTPKDSGTLAKLESRMDDLFKLSLSVEIKNNYEQII